MLYKLAHIWLLNTAQLQYSPAKRAVMIRQMIAVVVMFILFRLALEFLAGPNPLLDLWDGRMPWLPLLPLCGLPDIVSPLARMLPVFPLLPLIFLLVVGLLALAELD